MKRVGGRSLELLGGTCEGAPGARETPDDLIVARMFQHTLTS